MWYFAKSWYAINLVYKEKCLTFIQIMMSFIWHIYITEDHTSKEKTSLELDAFKSLLFHICFYIFSQTFYFLHDELLRYINAPSARLQTWLCWALHIISNLAPQITFIIHFDQKSEQTDFISWNQTSLNDSQESQQKEKTN